MTLVDWISGIGSVKRQDGTIVGRRHYDIEIWRPQDEAALPSATGPATIKASIELTPAERAEFARDRSELSLTLEDGRQFTFVVRDSDGTILCTSRTLSPRSTLLRTALGVLLPLSLLAALFLSDRFGLTPIVMSWIMTRSWGLAAVFGLVSLGVLVLGLPLASRARDPHRYRTGLVMLALGILGLWALPYSAYLLLRQIGWVEGLPALLALFALLGGAIGLIAGGSGKISASL